MVEYKCDKCEKIFKLKGDYIRHENKKRKCNNIQNKEYKCYYCEKYFTRMYSLNRHLMKCKNKNKENKHKYKLIEQMKEMDKNVKYNMIIQNNSNNNINIKLAAFGKEDISYITEEVYKQILNKGFESVPKFVEQIHFNKNKPENQNIYISNKQDKYAIIYDGNIWKLQYRDEILQQLYEYKMDILSNKFDELIGSLCEDTIKKFKRFLEYSEEDTTTNNIKKELRLILYNNKNIPEKTRRILELDKKYIKNEL